MSSTLANIQLGTSVATLDGLAVIDADQIYDNNQPINLSQYVPYSGATGPINLGTQNIQTAHVPVGGSDLTNKTYVDGAISSASILATNNTFTGTNTFSNTLTASGTVAMTGLSSGTAVNTLGLNASNQLVLTSDAVNLLPLNNTWTGTNTFNNNVTTAQGYQTNLNNSLLTTQVPTGQGASNFTTSGLPSSAPTGSTLSSTYTLTAGVSSGAMAMSLGSYVYDTNGWYQINLFGCYGSSTNIVFYVYQYNTAGTAYITLGGGVTLPSTSGTATTISATFQANTTVTYTGQVVFYFQATSVHQSVTFTSANLYVAETQFTGNVLLSYRNGTPIYTLGMDNTGNMVMYTNPTSSVFSGSVSTGYVPYASSPNNFANSVMYESGSFIGINNTSPNTYLCVGPNGGVNQSGNIPGISMTSVSGQNMAFSVGQGTAGTNNLLMAWNYNATASSGVGTLSCYGGNNPLVLQESGGNVGIGTLSPAQLLHLYADGARLRIESGTTNNPVLELKTNGNTSYMFTDQSGNLQLYPYTSGKYLLLASNGSFVGIGTATPGCALDVVGQVRSNSVGNNATITFTSTYGAFGAIESYAYNNVYTKLPVNINAYGGSIGIGRNSASLCTEEVQTNRLLCCNSFYITPAITGIFYPVVFSTVAAAGTGQNPWKICIARTSVHQDATWKGALMSTFEGNSSYWGNGADYFKFQICGTASSATFNYFIGNAYVDFTSGYLVVYLRGGTTYQYTCEGASLLYYPNGTVFSSYTIPAGNNTVLYSTSTATTPFNTTYYTYDSVTGFSGFSNGVDGGAVAATYNNGLTVQGTAISSLGGYETVDLTSGFLYTSYQYVSAALQVYGNIWTWGTVVYSSDQRIKTNIQPSSSLLSKINQIQLHSYDFIDKTNNSNVSTVCGLVAQQLAPIFPEYIRTGEGFIPNIYQRAKSLSLVDGNVQVVFATAITGQVVAGDIVEYVIYQITVGVPPPTNTEQGSPTIGSSRETSTVISLSADGLTMVMTPWLRCDPTTQGIIVYGKQVPDFLQVDYSKMSCLGIKGVQELSAQLTITNNTITDQATQIGSLQTTITSQANQIATQATQITTLQSTIESQATQITTLQTQLTTYITLTEERMNKIGTLLKTVLPTS